MMLLPPPAVVGRLCASCGGKRARGAKVAKKVRRGLSNAGDNAGAKPSEEKIARLLAMLVVKDIDSDVDKVPLLRSAGFNTAEVAEILGTTDATIRAADAYARK